MKKITALAVLIVMIMPAFLPGALASADYIDLAPGRYEIGTKNGIPAGNYDIRFNGLDQSITISYSIRLLEDGSLDMSHFYSFSFSYSSSQNWWSAGGFSVVLEFGYLDVSGSSCRLWPED